MRSERGKRDRDEKKIHWLIKNNIYIYIYILQSSYSELLLITAHCSSMLKFLEFSIFDVDVFLLSEVLKMLRNSI